MFRSHVASAFRSIAKHKKYSVTNILGLSVGMAVCLFIFQYVYFERNYDNFNKNSGRLYRVVMRSGSAIEAASAATHTGVAPGLKNDIPEIENFTRLVHTSVVSNWKMLSYKSSVGPIKSFNESKLYLADAAFFKLFSYTLLEGDVNTCLEEPNSIVLSKTMAQKYVGDESAVGKTLLIDGIRSVKITGVFRDVPANSHIQFDALLSLNTLGMNYGFNEFDWPEFYNYVLLRPQADARQVEAKFPGFVQKHMSNILREYGMLTSFQLQKVSDIHLHSHYEKEAEGNGSATEVSFLAITAIFVLTIAWVNYINLATARSLERCKEVGLRKVIGATKRQLVYQFMTEAAIINLVALCFSFVFLIGFYLFSESLTGKNIFSDFFSSGLGSERMFLPACALIFTSGCFLTGFYPAIITSSAKPVTIFRRMVNKSYGSVSLRRFLVGFQFSLSLVLVGATVVVYKQLAFMQKQDLGFNSEKVMVLKAPPVTWERLQKLASLKPAISAISGVSDVTLSSEVPGENIRYQNLVRKAGQDRSAGVGSNLLEVDDRFISTLQLRLIAGRNLSISDTLSMDGSVTKRIVINEFLAGLLGFTNAEKAVGQKVTLILGVNDFTCEIIGVVKNFQYKSLRAKYEPFLFYYPRITGWKYITLKLNTEEYDNVIPRIKNIYGTYFPGDPFEYFFLDEYFSRQYVPEHRLGRIFLFASGLAIFVACLGFLGLCSYVVKTRMKEIGIRKVLGASASNIVVLFSKDYLKLILFSAIVSLPVLYYVGSSWLEDFAFHFNLNIGLFLMPIFILLFISLSVTFAQTYRAAFTDPAKLIKSD